jgi:hypothetical protein
MRISEAALAYGKKREVKLDPFRGVHSALHPPGVGPTPEQLRETALDQGSIISSATPPPLQGWSGYNPAAITGWAFNNLASGFAEGTVFLGYPTLAVMAQRAVPGSGSGGDAWAAEHGMHVQTYTFAGRGQSVYMSTEPETAKAFARIAAKMHPGSKASVLKIVVPKDQVKDHLKYDEMTRSGGGGISSASEQEKDAFRFIGKIDPSWISKLGDYDPNERGAVSFAGDEEPDAKTIYAVILTDERGDEMPVDDGGNPAMDEFNASELRKPGGGEGGGEWTSGSGGGGSSKLISPRNITAKRAGESTKGKYSPLDLAAMKEVPAVFDANAPATMSIRARRFSTMPSKAAA